MTDINLESEIHNEVYCIKCESCFKGDEAKAFIEDTDEYDLVTGITNHLGHSSLIEPGKNESGGVIVLATFFVDRESIGKVKDWCKQNRFVITTHESKFGF